MSAAVRTGSASGATPTNVTIYKLTAMMTNHSWTNKLVLYYSLFSVS